MDEKEKSEVLSEELNKTIKPVPVYTDHDVEIHDHDGDCDVD